MMKRIRKRIGRWALREEIGRIRWREQRALKESLKAYDQCEYDSARWYDSREDGMAEALDILEGRA